TPEQLERLIRSVLNTFEENSFARIFARLSPHIQLQLDSLLETEPKPAESVVPGSTGISGEATIPQLEEPGEQEAQIISFQQLKNDPAGSTLKSILKEAR